MTQDITSKPIKWMMVVSAICLISFLFKFTSDSLAYLDYVDQQSIQTDQLSQKQLLKHRQIKKAKLIQNLTEIPANSP